MLKFLFFIAIIYLFFRLLGRYILPWLVKRYIKKTKKKFYQQNFGTDPGFQKKQKQKKSEGKINIKTEKKKKKDKRDDGLGEYVDYEEIDDN